MVEKLYTVKEAMEILRISHATLYRHISAGLIKPVKFGGKVLFTEKELERVIKHMKAKS
jgi:excisionase family DNA binding protein